MRVMKAKKPWGVCVKRPTHKTQSFLPFLDPDCHILHYLYMCSSNWVPFGWSESLSWAYRNPSSSQTLARFHFIKEPTLYSYSTARFIISRFFSPTTTECISGRMLGKHTHLEGSAIDGVCRVFWVISYESLLYVCKKDCSLICSSCISRSQHTLRKCAQYWIRS